MTGFNQPAVVGRKEIKSRQMGRRTFYFSNTWLLPKLLPDVRLLQLLLLTTPAADVERRGTEMFISGKRTVRSRQMYPFDIRW